MLGRFVYRMVLGFLLLVVACHRKSPEIKDDIIAKVGSQSLTLTEFRLFYELDPNFGIDSTGLAALRDELDLLIDRYLAARLAEEQGLFSDSTFQKAISWERRQAILRELYRQQVSQRVRITEEELKKEFFTSNIKVHVRHLFTRDSLQARRWYQALRQGASFDSLATVAFRDSVLARKGGDLGWQRLASFDDDFAEAVVQLKPGEISFPVRTRWGYHIIQLLDRQDQVILSEAEFSRQRPALEKRLRRKKSRQLANQFISEYMGRLNPQPVPATFARLWDALHPPGMELHNLPQTAILFTPERVTALKRKLANHLSEPLIRYRGGQISLGEYLDALKDIPVSQRPRFKTPRQLSNDIGKWVRDEFLLKEAYRRGLDKSEKVQKEVEEFIREQAYYHFLEKSYQELEVPPEIINYFSSSGKKEMPSPLITKLKKFHTLQEWKWYRATRLLRHRLRSAFQDFQINEPLLVEENRRIDWRRQIPMFIIRKPE